jgi:hypothetical protein
MDNKSKSQTFENKEVKGVIYDELETKECKCKGIEDQNRKTKGLPHKFHNQKISLLKLKHWTKIFHLHKPSLVDIWILSYHLFHVFYHALISVVHPPININN